MKPINKRFNKQCHRCNKSKKLIGNKIISDFISFWDTSGAQPKLWGRIEGETINEFWLPKGALIKTHTIKDVVVDYEKYSNRPPLEHQKLAIEKLAGSKRFILADDMGLGKTVQTLTLLLAQKEKNLKIKYICGYNHII